MVQLQTGGLTRGRCISYGKPQLFIHEEFILLYFLPQHLVKLLNDGARLQRAAFKDALLVDSLFYTELLFYPVQFCQFQDDFVTPVLVDPTIGALHEFAADVCPAELLRNALFSLSLQPAAVGGPSICNDASVISVDVASDAPSEMPPPPPWQVIAPAIKEYCLDSTPN